MDELQTRITASFARQGLMRSFMARIVSVAPGACVIEAPVRPETSQQHGAAHAGLTFSLGDSAAGYAALTLLPEGMEVMTAEMKINLLRPGIGTRLQAEGAVLRAGRRLVVVRADVFALDAGERRLIAALQGTMIPVPPQAVTR